MAMRNHCPSASALRVDGDVRVVGARRGKGDAHRWPRHAHDDAAHAPDAAAVEAQQADRERADKRPTHLADVFHACGRAGETRERLAQRLGHRDPFDVLRDDLDGRRHARGERDVGRNRGAALRGAEHERGQRRAPGRLGRPGQGVGERRRPRGRHLDRHRRGILGEDVQARPVGPRRRPADGRGLLPANRMRHAQASARMPTRRERPRPALRARTRACPTGWSTAWNVRDRGRRGRRTRRTRRRTAQAYHWSRYVLLMCLDVSKIRRARERARSVRRPLLENAAESAASAPQHNDGGVGGPLAADSRAAAETRHRTGSGAC